MSRQLLQSIFLPILYPISRGYAAAMRHRRMRYSLDLETRYSPACPTISVGNIALGGTGKTPIVGWILEWAAKHSLKAIVLTRGYGGKTGDNPVVVQTSTLTSIAGDEPVSLARSYPTATVIAHPKRVLSANLAERDLSPDFFVLDDGMQHLAIKRDLNLVLLRPDDIRSDWDKVLPAGFWREGESALASASAFLMKIPPQQCLHLEPLIRMRLAQFNTPLFTFSLVAGACRKLGCHGASNPPTGEYLLLSGVGNPAQVKATAKQLTGRLPKQHSIFPDHYAYTERSIQKLISSGLPIVCTEKDAVKIEYLLPTFNEIPVYAFAAQVVFGPTLFSTTSFSEWWENWWIDKIPKRD